MPKLLDLKPRTCRYPLYDGVFCGRGPTVSGSSYCRRHHPICVVGRSRPLDELAKHIERKETARRPREETVRRLDEVLR